MDLPIEVPLARPVVVGDTTYDVLKFDEPDLEAQIAFAELEATFPETITALEVGRLNRFWISRLADIPEAVAGKIKDSDLVAVGAAMSAIMEARSEIQSDADAGAGSGNETPAK